MSWKTIDRNVAPADTTTEPVLTEAVRNKIRSFFDRYDTKRAAMLPALHIVQHALGHISWQAMSEIADVLELHPSEVMDTLTFYTQFWTHPKGAKVVTVCRSISCDVMGGTALLDEVKRVLGIDEHGTTPDGKYSLLTEECLACCDHAPCMHINEKLHKCVKPQDVAKILADDDNDRIEFERSDLFDAPADTAPVTPNGATNDTDPKNSDAAQPGKVD